MYYSIITGFGFSVFLGNQTEDVVCTAFFIWSFKVSQSPFFTKLTKIVDGEKELQEEKTFSIFIQTDYILNETSNIARTEKKTNRFTTEYITSSNVCICKCAFARVFL